MATFESKNIVLTRKLDGVVYEIMVKTVADMVYVDDSTTLTEKLYDIADLFTEYGNRQNELAEAYSKLVAGADENYNTFKEIWDYININGNPKSELIQLIESKQTSEEGKGLSTNDLTDVLYEKLVNDYTKEELVEKFNIIKNEHDQFVNDLEARLSAIDEKIEEIEDDITEVKATPNVVVSESADDETMEKIADYSCWYQVISKD